ncbi:hypothetical protein DWQ65_02330 [Treponema phagedenis]|uniref:Uncharacterized protein n=2 Tax=Treponema phagedenis TaxID=162 RepID=A0A0B7GXL9_TREPH|nr:hypothetical protein [Treponema phagedenis]NVP23048.1 hypothetical protein [Treponema phagedenis]NVP23507.1 hypothetical protein [Treponema phagedenis]QEJ94662.1 hypothetical protein FUT79_05225 [Treponema phagedenis]QEJ95197.1 hypothetical protein FUT79_08300 [Treponema phagedenis]QEJ95808.1 hypothetical protein FUT79_11780 [Treponema phagedenis]
MLEVVSAKNYCIIKMPNSTQEYRLERKAGIDGEWETLTASGFIKTTTEPPVPVKDVYLDKNVKDGVYGYRVQDVTNAAADWEYSVWVKCGAGKPVGYTFGNYKAPEGQWGEIVTPDDLHYTYLWGVDFRASNGMPYTDEQVRFHINSSLREMERRLNITIEKKRIACEPQRRGLKKGVDYDEEESFYSFHQSRIQRQGFIPTRKRPVIKVSKLDLLSRTEKVRSLMDCYTLDKTKGLIKFFNRPFRMSDTRKAIHTSISPYGAATWESNLFYSIDYVAGYESSDDVPADLRAVIAKLCAVELLNIIGDGLISGFSSSSLSMDGVSESFSSTQSATSAYYGARIKVYEDELKNYIEENKMKFGHVVMGAL